MSAGTHRSQKTATDLKNSLQAACKLLDLDTGMEPGSSCKSSKCSWPLSHFSRPLFRSLSAKIEWGDRKHIVTWIRNLLFIYLIFSFYVHGCFACIYVCLCTMCLQWPQRPEESVGFPGIGVTVVSLHVDAGNQTQAHGGTTSNLNNWVISPAPEQGKLNINDFSLQATITMTMH